MTTSPNTGKKKPRARKLEKDRARGTGKKVKPTSGKKSSGKSSVKGPGKASAKKKSLTKISSTKGTDGAASTGAVASEKVLRKSNGKTSGKPAVKSGSGSARKYTGKRPEKPNRQVHEQSTTVTSRGTSRNAQAFVRNGPVKKQFPSRPHKHEHPDLASTWKELGIHSALLSVLHRHDIATPFPIQQATLPDSLQGRDVLGRGQTGSGKTLAFGLALLTRLAGKSAKAKHPLGIILVPTRELAMQVRDSLMAYAHAVELNICLIAGGMPYAKQIDALKRGAQVVVATPGRLNDLLEQGHINLSHIEITVLDEADQMCDMGFLPQIVETLDQTPKQSQRLLFSATLDGDVDTIVRQYLHKPVEHATEPAQASVSTMHHYLFVVYREDKSQVLAQVGSRSGKTVFFARTQLGVERIANELAQQGIPAGALHGGKTQSARTKTLQQFKDGITQVLVATDVAARGIHVDGVSLVVHVDPPSDAKDYLHRAGRTARAGESGSVVTMVNPRQLRGVQQMTDKAGVAPELVRVKPMSRELVSITGAKQPSGTPWVPPREPAKRTARSGAPRKRRFEEPRRKKSQN